MRILHSYLYNACDLMKKTLVLMDAGKSNDLDDIVVFNSFMHLEEF